MPLVSIVLTSYNHAQYIGEAISSVLEQTFKDFELIIWDDASSDNSWHLIKQYTDPRIKAFHNEEQKRGAWGINKAISEVAAGEYIAIHHSDDVWGVDKLEKQVAILDTCSEVGAVFTWVQVIDEHGATQVNDWFSQENKSQWQWLNNIFQMRNHLAHPSVLIRKKCYQEVGGYRNFLAQSGDVEMWSRLLIRYPIHVIPEKLTKHRLFSDKSNISGDRIDVKIRIANDWNFVRENFLSIDDIEHLVSIFPSLECSGNDGQFNTKFLLAMVCIYECDDRAAWCLGMKWLYDLFRDPVQVAEITRLYSFTYKDLIKLTGEVDSYGLGDLAKLNVDLNAVSAIRDAAVADRDAAVAELDKVYRSIPWKITKPIRSFVFYSKRLIQSGRLLLFNVLSIFTLVRFKKGLALLKAGNVSELKRYLEFVWKENAKQARQSDIPEIIQPLKLYAGQPLVSVIIPCFNYGRFVVDAIDCILNQTLKNAEIIVVDGGSNDGTTIRTLKQVERPRTRIFLRNERHLVGDNRNYGIEKASGRYVCCLDADDTLEPTYLEKAVFYLETYGYDIVSTAINYIGAKTGQIDSLEFPDLSDMVNGNHILTCAVYRKQLWESVSGYFDAGIGEQHVAEDWDFWLRLAAKGARIHNISGEYLFNYRSHEGGSLSTSSDVKSLADQQLEILHKNRELLTPEAFRFSAERQSKYLRCDPSLTALAQSFNTESSGGQTTLLLAMPFCLVGGAEKLLSGLCAYLADHDWRIIVVTTLPQDPGFGNSFDWFRKSTSEIYALTNFLRPREYGDFIQYLIASRNPGCILNTGSRLVYEQLPSIKASFPNVGVVDLLFNTTGHVDSHMEFKEFISFALAENMDVYDWFIDVAQWPKNLVRKVSSGVDLTGQFPAVRPKSLVEKYKINNDEIVIGFSGRLSEEKAPDVFVEIATLCQCIPNLRFIMTGSGPMTEALSIQAKALPSSVRFEFAGLVDDVNQYLALYDVLILPSRLDGRPLVVMEALASGVPVIASNLGGLPDLIEDGVNGFLVPAANAKNFAGIINTLAADKEMLARLKASARQTAEEKLDANAAYSEYETALREVMPTHTYIT